MFTLYEDPATSTTGLWSGTDIFGDAIVHDGEQQLAAQENVSNDGNSPVNFAAILKEVQENGTKNLHTVEAAAGEAAPMLDVSPIEQAQGEASGTAA
jgi:aminoglycoside N3'-acetyltransferase